MRFGLRSRLPDAECSGLLLVQQAGGRILLLFAAIQARGSSDPPRILLWVATGSRCNGADTPGRM